MKKLIELDAALDALREVIVPQKDIGFGDELTDGYNDGIKMAVTVVSELPTVDAVPVVRCKDCKFFSHGYCRFHDAKFVRPDGYCYWGERKDGDHAEGTV